MAWYDTGTVSVTNGSTTVTGAGTNFVAGVQVGEGFSGPDGRIYEIQAVVSATSLTLADPYLSSTQTGQDYKIVPTQSLVANLASQVSTLISDFQGVVDEAGAGKFDDGTAASAGITFLQDQDTGFFRPAANQIGMTTAGVQRALLTSTGLNSTVIGATTPASGTFTTLTGTAVGIGTGTPAYDLVIQKGSPTLQLLATGTNIGTSRIFFGDADTAVRGQINYTHSNDNLSFTVNAQERLRIDGSGKVGIGTDSPAQKLVTYASSGNLEIINTVRNANGGSGTAAYGFNVSNGSEGDFTQAGIGFQRGVANGGGALVFYNKSDGATGNFTTANERMRVDASGNVLVGTINATVGSSNTDTGTAISGSGTIFISKASAVMSCNRNSSNGALVLFRRQGDSVGSISVTTSATSYNTSSDYRLKTDAQPMTGASARVQALNPVNFEWIVDGSRVDGFLAHEAQEVVPEAVSGTKDAMRDEEYEVTAAVYEDVVIPAVLDDDGNEIESERTEQQLVTEAVMGTRSVPDYQGIDQSKLVPLLTAALQEALTKIDDLETRLTALEG